MKKQKFEWNKVTPLSKYIALALMILLPFIGFVLGVKYQTLVGCMESLSPLLFAY